MLGPDVLPVQLDPLRFESKCNRPQAWLEPLFIPPYLVVIVEYIGPTVFVAVVSSKGIFIPDVEYNLNVPLP